MINTFLKNYRKTIGIGVVSLSATVLIGAGIAGSYGTGKRYERSMEVTVPSAGIASVIYDAVENTTATGEENVPEKEISAGIASVLNDYYLAQAENDNISPNRKGLEKVVSMLPGNDTAGTLAVLGPEAESALSTEQETPQAEPVTEAPTEPPVENKPVASILPEYTVLGVANVTNYLNVREEPDLDGKILGKLPMNAGCEIIEETNGWYKVKSGELEGYVAGEYLLTGEAANQRAAEALSTVALVKADKLMVREQPNTECTILTKVAENEELEVAEMLDGWIKVNIDSVTGYVCADYVQVYNTLPKGVTLKQLSYGEGVTSTAVDLIEYAKQFLGNPYVWGGTSLTKGADCSGFTMRIFEHFGYSLSRTSAAQSNNGRRVSLSEIQPGDLLFYNHGSRIGHVAIYIGNGQIIHASTERTGIIISNAYYTTPACAARIIE